MKAFSSLSGGSLNHSLSAAVKRKAVGFKGVARKIRDQVCVCVCVCARVCARVSILRSSPFACPISLLELVPVAGRSRQLPPAPPPSVGP